VKLFQRMLLLNISYLENEKAINAASGKKIAIKG
jgi:hypothetical protein